MNPAAPVFPLAAAALAPSRARAEARGSGDFSPLRSGQNPIGCKEIPAARLTQELAACLCGQQKGLKKGVGPEVGMGVVVETTPRLTFDPFSVHLA
jgi:hypothetical protein